MERTQRLVAATHGSERVQVATFALLRPYTTALFDRVAKELTARMAQVSVTRIFAPLLADFREIAFQLRPSRAKQRANN